MDFVRRRRLVQEINLTALIDIVFHLMVFVMLTTSFVVSESMELSLPSGKSQGESVVKAMRLVLVSDGSIMVDGEKMESAGLNESLVSRLTTDPETKIAIFTTKSVSVQQLVNVMDMVYLAGGHNVQVDKAE